MPSCKDPSRSGFTNALPKSLKEGRKLSVLKSSLLKRKQGRGFPGSETFNAVANLADERLLIEAARNDPSRFAELYEKNFDRVYAFVARRVRDRGEAEDLTAEAFHQALLNIGRFQWRGVPFAAWLLRISGN